MDILYTGNLTLLSDQLFHCMDNHNRCVLYDENLKGKIKDNHIDACFLNEDRDDNIMSQIFGTYEFKTVVFLSHGLDGTLKVFDELEKIENIIYQSRVHRVENFIYICSNDLINDNPHVDAGSRKIVMDACRKLCLETAGSCGINFTLLYVPYIYGGGKADNQLNRWIRSAVDHKKLNVLGAAAAETDFIYETDLGELLARMIDHPADDSFMEMHISGDNRITFQQVVERIAQNTRQKEIVYANHVKCMPIYNRDERAKREYGWMPQHKVLDDIDVLVEQRELISKKLKYKKARRLKYNAFKENLRIILELIITFAVVMCIEHWTKNNILLNFIDYKFVYVIVMGMVNGMHAGIIAAILSSVGFILEKSGTVPWQILFYNVQNWLPFACYFLLGTITGYAKDKHENQMIFSKEEHNILEEKYKFLSELYGRVLRNKEAYNNQIIGYKDSWGKLYSAVKELDSSLTEEVVYKAVNVLEETLDNGTVAIFSTSANSSFARLHVCSKSINNEMSKSINLSEYSEMMDVVKNGKMFVNVDCLEHYPAYATAVVKNEEIVALIFLMNASEEQMNTEYANKFMIVSNLVKDSLIRAMDIDVLEQSYVDGTMILKVDKFEEILEIKEQMRQKEYMEYTLFKVSGNGKTIQELGMLIAQLVRSNDVIGLREDGNVYLLLSQADETGIKLVKDRLDKNQIRSEVVKG
ncbi:MAG: hypothetical protein PHW47_08295 [Lachnospira sp.]|nr:hypothetical protein [Lachnospira sp.]